MKWEVLVRALGSSARRGLPSFPSDAPGSPVEGAYMTPNDAPGGSRHRALGCPCGARDPPADR